MLRKLNESDNQLNIKIDKIKKAAQSESQNLTNAIDDILKYMHEGEVYDINLPGPYETHLEAT